mmetsp:Transcript_14945/g.21317  ORF Transcript_14945/g.21317 Transcript_14945/m.21317 type:complete len:107 (-) Transcript_14945:97-417(-)
MPQYPSPPMKREECGEEKEEEVGRSSGSSPLRLLPLASKIPSKDNIVTIVLFDFFVQKSETLIQQDASTARVQVPGTYVPAGTASCASRKVEGTVTHVQYVLHTFD